MAFMDIQMWDCPFCGKSVLTCGFIPRTLRPYKTSWGGSKPGYKRTMEQLVIQFQECPNCKKSSDEIQKKWKEMGVL